MFPTAPPREQEIEAGPEPVLALPEELLPEIEMLVTEDEAPEDNLVATTASP